MNAIKVPKDKLLTTLRENRDKHKAQFERASDGYRTKVIKLMEDRLAEARKGKLPVMAFHMPLPVNQTSAYDRVIGMLEMTVEDVIELEEVDYQQYVLDEWHWSASTSATNAMYVSGVNGPTDDA